MDCEFAYRCRHSLKYKNDGKRFVELNPSYERLKDEARKLLLSPEGIRMRILRSIQSEGVFEIMKEDMSKVRSKRTGIRKAELEMMLFSCGFNVRKLFSFISGNTNAVVKYELPEDTPREEFPKVKPSKKRKAKKLSELTLWRNQFRNSPIHPVMKDSYFCNHFENSQKTIINNISC